MSSERPPCSKKPPLEPIGQHPHQSGSQPPRGLPARVHAPVLVKNCHIASAELFFPFALRTLCCSRRAFSRYLRSARTLRTAAWMFEAVHLVLCACCHKSFLPLLHLIDNQRFYDRAYL
jgi:hypothetical protein